MMTMEELLASQTQTRINIYRGQQIEGEVVSINDKEITLDLGAKSEGVIQARDFSGEQLEKLKVGDKVQAFVYQAENESGQVGLSLTQRTEKSNFRGKHGISFGRFLTAKSHKSHLQGKVMEVNKGGLIVEVEGARGFLPNSQIGFNLLQKITKKNPDPVGLEVGVFVSEVDEANNRLIFTQKEQVSPEDLAIVKQFKKDQKLTGETIAILPFALVIDLGEARGIVYIADASWERTEDLASIFKLNEQIEVEVTGVDEGFGRLNLSIKHLQEDPFVQIAENYPADEVVKGEITAISEPGVSVRFKDNVEGFLPTEKKDASLSYEVGASMTFLVDGIDSRKRRVNLAPFITSTAGLIYK